MRLRSDGGEIPRIHGVVKRDRSEPGQDSGHNGDDTPKKCEGGTKSQWKSGSAEWVRVEGNGQVFAPLPHAEEVLQMDCRVPASVRRIESLPFHPTIAKSITTRWRTFFSTKPFPSPPLAQPWSGRKKRCRNPYTTPAGLFAEPKRGTRPWRN